VTPPELRALLADSLAVWGVEARVAIEGEGVRVGALLVMPAAEPPIRWWLESEGRRRPCTSVLGLLRALRNALGGGETRRLRGA
jgi:hypothetical protein